MKVKGSYTVEAALLMTIILPMLVGIIYLSFYLHNVAALKSGACELAAYASLQQGEEECERRIEEKRQEILARYLPGMKGIRVEITIGKKALKVSSAGVFVVPGLSADFFGRKEMEISVQSELAQVDETKVISQIHLLKKLGQEGEE